MAVNRDMVVISEQSKHCLSVFRPSGQKIRSFGKRGSGLGQFDIPGGVTLDCEGNILVVDKNNNRIQRLTIEGLFLSAVGAKGSGALHFNFPYDVAFNRANNKVYVADTNNHRVQVLNFFSITFGSEGSGQGQFWYPLGITCDGTGKVYVADTHRVQVFTAMGVFLNTFGESIAGPIGIAVDTTGVVYVSENNNHRVSVFTSDGQLVTLFG